jgi:hypothetical protein
MCRYVNLKKPEIHDIQKVTARDRADGWKKRFLKYLRKKGDICTVLLESHQSGIRKSHVRRPMVISSS